MKKICLVTSLYLFTQILLAGCSSSEINKQDYGADISNGDQSVYGQNMIIQAFEDAVVISFRGKTEIITIKNPSPRQPVIGDILGFYNHPHQADVLGAPLQGEHIMFNGKFNVHIFEKGVVIWERDTRTIQSVIFSKKLDIDSM